MDELVKTKKQLLDEMEAQFALPGYRDYINAHFKEAQEVLQNEGCMFDLNNIVHLERLLGREVSYDLYSYIDSTAMYEDISLQELSDRDIEDLEGLCQEFAKEKGDIEMNDETGIPDVKEIVGGKYEMTDELITVEGHELHRIRALKDFGRVCAGDLGGFIEKTENLSQDSLCWVNDDAKVYGDARVFDAAFISGEAVVCGNASVFDDAAVTANALVMDHATISENAYISGDAMIYGEARISGEAIVNDNASIGGKSSVRDNAHVSGCVNIRGHAVIADHASVFDYARVSGYARVYGQSAIFGRAELTGFAKTDGWTRVRDDAQIYGCAVLGDHASVSDRAQVSDHALLEDTSIVRGNAVISGNAKLLGVSIVQNNAKVTGCAVLNGWCRVQGHTELNDGVWDRDALKKLADDDKKATLVLKDEECSKR